MITDVALLVLRCADLPASKAFYEALGLTFRLEKHGRGPEHWSCQIGSLVLELYPTSTAPTSTERLGFHVVDVQAAVTAEAVSRDQRSSWIRMGARSNSASPPCKTPAMTRTEH